MESLIDLQGKRIHVLFVSGASVGEQKPPRDDSDDEGAGAGGKTSGKGRRAADSTTTPRGNGKKGGR